MKLAVALAGGGARGAAHVGILQAMEDNGIKADIYTGTSAGSIIAAAKATDYNNKMIKQLMTEINSKLLDYNYWGLIKALPSRFSSIEAIMKGDKLKEFLTKNFNVSISTCKYPLGIVSTDVDSAMEIVFSSKPLHIDHGLEDIINVYDGSCSLNLSDMLYASSAIPGIYPPYLFDNHKLIDGSVVNNLSGDVAMALGADKVIAIDLSAIKMVKQISGIYGILSQTVDILVDRNKDLALTYAQKHLYLDPGIRDVTILEFNKMNELYLRGYKYGQSMIQTIEDFIEAP
jgi:NTE family protein